MFFRLLKSLNPVRSIPNDRWFDHQRMSVTQVDYHAGPDTTVARDLKWLRPESRYHLGSNGEGHCLSCWVIQRSDFE